jgi:thiol:disulfide interchange protein DsbA
VAASSTDGPDNPGYRRRELLRGGAALLAALASRQARAAAEERQPYRLIPQQPVPAGALIDVVEFFWYGCPYCYELAPLLDAWLVRKPADVALRYIPAVFRRSWMPHARIYYTLEALGELGRLHDEVYHSYHLEQLPLEETEAIADWAVRHGIDRARWLSVYESQDIDRKIDAARETLRSYTVAGTPSLAVDGRYLTSSGMTPGVPAMIPVLDRLIAMARQDRARR